VNRGDIFRVRPRDRSGREQQGARFAVVVQTDGLMRLSTVVVAPTSTNALAASFRPTIEFNNENTRVLVDQITAIDATRLGKRVGHVEMEELWAIDDALRMVLAL
jgi:mRNA interferase MazF